jgi:flagellar basal body rod protein FlgB
MLPTSYSELFKLMTPKRLVSVAITNSGHISGTRPPVKFKSYDDPEAVNFSENGNNIEIPEQLHKASMNQIQYNQLVSSIAKLNEFLILSVKK